MQKNKYLPEISSTPVKVLFVCLGNICRSPAAEGVFLDAANRRNVSHLFEVDSAGTYGGHVGQLPDNRMRVHARRRGYDLVHRCRRVTGSDFEDFDIIVGMDNNNMYALRQLASTVEESRKIVSMASFFRQFPQFDHVPDPYYEGSEGFELVLDMLEDACECLLDEILNQLKYNHAI